MCNNFKMTDRIAAMVKQGDSQSIQHYVKANLPSDQAGLQRIYKQLLRYSEKKPSPPKQSKKQSTTRSISLKALNSKHMDHSQAAYQKRSNGIMQKLREKGFKILFNEEEEGLKIFQQKRSKLVKPLITNSKLLQSGQAGIDRLIQRFNANSDFYLNNIDDIPVDVINNVDREMREFINRRQAVLSSFQKQQQLELNRYAKYANIAPKVTQPAQTKVSARQTRAPLSRKSSRFSMQQLKSTQNLMETCQRQIMARKFKQIPIERNDFQALQRRIQGYDQDELNIGNLINLQKVRQRMSREQYQRYTHSYMKMMTNKNQEGSKCKLNPYAKELLQDERKMRNIIDFSQQ